MIIGVIGVQGNVSEHIESLEKALTELKKNARIKWVRKAEELDDVDALIIPGGESTTISKLVEKAKMFPKIIEKARKGVPIMGTCAGCILLAKDGGESVRQSKTKLLGLMDMTVERNAFGRQLESFEAYLQIEGLDNYPAVFIRAPVITKVWDECEVLAVFNEKIVMARQGNLLALAFHPELSNDTRVHKMLIGMIKS
jgi:5'-phosphate synthase pdxT subunit